MSVFEEKTLSSELIFDGKVVHLYKDTVSLPNGKSALREYVKHIGAVCIIPITDEGEVVCVRQYRYAVGKDLIEIPAGKLDSADEIPEEAALRELREETGARCKKLTFIGEYLGSPAILSEKIYMYMAEELEWGECSLDEDEFLSVEKMPVNELCEMICRGEITDGKTQVAILKAALIINLRKSKNK